MRAVPIKIFITGSTVVRQEGVKAWLKHIGVSEEFLSELEDAFLETSDPAMLVALNAKRCYMSFEVGLNANLTMVRKNWVEYLDNVLKSKHGSVLEHSVYTFAIEGVSRVFTAEMNRHRAGVAISEGSMRYIRLNDIPYWVPDSITLTQEEKNALQKLCQDPGEISPEELGVAKLGKKKLDSQEVFRQAFGQDEANYSKLMEIWKDELAPTSKFHQKKQITSMMRRVVGIGVATGEVVTLNLRAIRHIMALRATAQAEEEMLHVWSQAGKMIIDECPEIFGDFTQTPEGYWIPKYEKV